MKGDLIHAWRALMRAPVMVLVVVVSLGMGIGVNTIVFSWIQALVFRPMPGVTDASRFYLIEPETDASLRPGASWREFEDLKNGVRAFESLMAFRMAPFTTGVAPTTERATGLLISGEYFSTLGIQPAAGRFVRPDEVARAGGEPVVVISHDYWKTHFSGSSDVVGRSLRVNDVDLTIVGVTPEGFQGTILGLQFDLWVPATLAPVLLSGSRELEDRSLRGYYVMGTLRPDATRDVATADVAAAMAQLAREFPATNSGVSARVLTYWRASRGPQGMLLQGLGVLQVIMLVLLLAVCGNTANLMLARASARVREVGVRLAIGAGSWRIVRLLFVESAVLGLAAAGIGALITLWGTNALRAVPVLTFQFPVRFQTSLNEQSLLFAIGLGVACAMVFGLAPALQLARVVPSSVLRSGSAPPMRGSSQRALMAAEAALAATVLIAAALFFRSLQQGEQADPGFEPRGVLLAGYDLTGRDVDWDGARRFGDRVLQKLRALPDVESAALAVAVPLDIHGLPARAFTLEGRVTTTATPDRARSNTVTPGYFDTMGIRLLDGHDFAELSNTAEPPEVIVNQAFVEQYIGDGVVVGRRITVRDTAHTIIGVVETTLNDSFTEPPTPALYLSYRHWPSRATEMHVRTRLKDETMLASAIRSAVREVDESLPVYNIRTLTQHVDLNLQLRRIPARMFMVLGPLLLVLAAIGIYAVVAYNVAQRTSEIGVRVALGATSRQVLTQIVLETLRVVTAGAIAGWMVAAGFYTHLMRGALDVIAFGVMPVLLLAVSAVACWLPARRAATIDPVNALRAE
jgi:predicted permease